MFYVVLMNYLFGIWIFIRKLDKNFKENVFLESDLTKIGTFYLLFLFICSLTLKNKPLLLLISIHIPFIFMFFLEFFMKIKRKKQFEREFQSFLSQMILQMRTGSSFRQAIQASNQENERLFKVKIQKIFNIVTFSQQNAELFSNDRFVKEIIEEFIRIDQRPHMALAALIGFKNKLQLESEFRHKSGRILYQVRIQSLIISGIYFALFFFMFKEYGFLENIKLMGLSVALYLIGVVLLLLMGRSFKWNI